jgi:hypothetical protein
MKKYSPKKKKTAIKRVKKKLNAVKKAVLQKTRRISSKSNIPRHLQKVRKLGTIILEQAKHAISVPFSEKEKNFSAEFATTLPTHYNETRAVLLVRDPWWVFAYWEVREDHETRVRADVLRAGEQPDKKILRLYDLSDGTFFDIETGFAGNWYIDLGKPDHECFFEIGIRAQSGRFFPLVRSNTVKTPPYGFSNVIDEEWMMPDGDYWKLFGEWDKNRKSSYDIQDYLKKFIQSVSSHTAIPPIPSKRTRSKIRTEISVKVRRKKFI